MVLKFPKLVTTHPDMIYYIISEQAVMQPLGVTRVMATSHILIEKKYLDNSDSANSCSTFTQPIELLTESARWRQRHSGLRSLDVKKVTGIQKHTTNVEMASSTEDTQVRGSPDRTRQAK